MKLKFPRASFILVLLSVTTLAACSSGRAAAAITCTDVCDRLSTLCVAAPPYCMATCESSVDTSARACTVGASSCESALACANDPGTDGGQSSDMNTGADSGGSVDSGPRTCDGAKTCSDVNTVSYCEDGITRSSPCNGHPCAAGRCGSCSSADDCRALQYRCRCADGTERTGVVDGSCSDSEADMRWCGHPSIASSACGAQGFDPEFG